MENAAQESAAKAATTVKATAKPKSAKTAKPVKTAPAAPARKAAAPAKAAKKTAPAKAAAKSAVAPAPKPAKVEKSVKAAKPVKPVKENKPEKLVRDSFTIPRGEYTLLQDLKLRASTLGRPAKKSEVLRAGIQALKSLDDAALLAVLGQVPVIKTGRPSRD